MKTSLLLFAILLFVFRIKGQEKISFIRNSDSNLTRLLGNVREYKQFEGKNIAIVLYLVGNSYKTSSNIPAESDEVSDNLYISVSEFGEEAEKSLFILKDIFGVINLELSNTTSNDDAVTLAFSYFDRKVKLRKKYTAIVSLNKLVAINN